MENRLRWFGHVQQKRLRWFGHVQQKPTSAQITSDGIIVNGVTKTREHRYQQLKRIYQLLIRPRRWPLTELNEKNDSCS